MVTRDTIAIRIRYADWKKIRRYFPSYNRETAQSYFFRLTQFIVEAQNEE